MSDTYRARWKSLNIKIPILVLILFSVDTAKAWAEDSQDHFLIVGPAWSPEYWGSDQYSIVPMLITRFALFDRETEVEGLDLRTALGSRSNWDYGLAAALDLGREPQPQKSPESELDTIPAVLNLGPYVSVTKPNLFGQTDELTVSLSTVADVVDEHAGGYARVSASYAFPMVIPWRFEFELETTYASADYMDTYFGVSHKEAQRSELEDYQPGSSFRDISLHSNVGLFFSRKRGVFLRTSWTRLLADAANSPVTQLGSTNQYFFGLGYFHRFGE